MKIGSHFLIKEAVRRVSFLTLTLGFGLVWIECADAIGSHDSLKARELVAEKVISPSNLGRGFIEDEVEEVRRQLELSDRTDVWVRLNTAFEYDAVLERSGRSAEISEQANRIAQSEARLLNSLNGSSQIKISFGGFIPWVVLDIDSAGFEKLLESADAAMIQPVREGEFLLRNSTRQVRAAASSSNASSLGAWGYGFEGETRTVAVIDTGLNKAHAAFQDPNKIEREACFSDSRLVYPTRTPLCPNGQVFDTQVPCPNFDGGGRSCGHGTGVSGIVAGNHSGSDKGVSMKAGLFHVFIGYRSNSSIYCGDLDAPCLRFSSDILSQALQYVFANRNQVPGLSSVNLSLSIGPNHSGFCGSHTEGGVTDAINQLHNSGIAVVAASGNDGETSKISYPACLPSTISVASVDSQDNPSTFSNVSSALDLYAPGGQDPEDNPDLFFESIRVPHYDNTTGIIMSRGTSQAAPHVAAAFAIMREQRSDRLPLQTLSVLRSTGVVIPHSNFNHPRIDLLAALAHDVSVPATVNAAAAGGVITIPVTTVSGTRWAARKDPSSWMSFQVREGLGSGGVQLVLSENYSTQARSSSVHVLGHEVNIVQSGTSGSPTDPPTVTTLSTINISQTSAVLRGSANPNGLSANAWFDWGPSTSYGNSTTSISLGSGTGSVSFERTISGLQCGTTYFFRARAQNSAGTTNGSQRSFTTQACPSGAPEIEIYRLQNVSNNRIYVDTDVWPNGRWTTVHFDWGFSSGSFPNSFEYDRNPIDPTNVGSSGMYIADGYLHDVQCGTTYYFRPRAVNSSGTGVADPDSITTPPCPAVPPIVQNLEAENILHDQARIRGQVNAQGHPTEYRFRWGTGSMNNSTTWLEAGSGTNFQTHTTMLTGLQCGTEYQYRIEARNDGGTTQAESSQSFNTAPCPILEVNSHPISSIPVTGVPEIFAGSTDYTVNVSYGQQVELVAPVVFDGRPFEQWQGCDQTEGDREERCLVQMTSDRAVTANFGPIHHELTVTSSGFAGFVVYGDALTPSGSWIEFMDITEFTKPIPEGSDVWLYSTGNSVDPESTFAMTGWSGCDAAWDELLQGYVCFISLMTDRTVNLEFVEIVPPDILSFSIDELVSHGARVTAEILTVSHEHEVRLMVHGIDVNKTFDYQLPASSEPHVITQSIENLTCDTEYFAILDVFSEFTFDSREQTFQTLPCQLSVKSEGAAEVVIEGVPSLSGGVTDYSMFMPETDHVELTAPAEAGELDFVRWRGCSETLGDRARTCRLPTNDSASVTALYFDPDEDPIFHVDFMAAGEFHQFSASPAEVMQGQSIQVVWDTEGFEHCTASGFPGWLGAQSVSGSRLLSTSPVSPGPYTLILACTGPRGSAQAAANVTVVPDFPESGFAMSIRLRRVCPEPSSACAT